MRSLPPWPAMTRLNRETKDTYVEQFANKAPNASLETARLAVAADYGFANWQELRVAVTRAQDGVPGEPDSSHLRVLTDAGTQDKPHAGYSLYDHLVGTRDLLAEWGNPDSLAVAGLFHSIYGTEYYKITSVPLERRREIAGRIGDRAEALAYVFCVSHRPDFFTQLGSPRPTLRDRVCNTTLPIEANDLRALIELEAANVVEQVYPQRATPERVAAIRNLLDAGGRAMSEGAQASLAAVIDQCAACLAAQATDLRSQR